MSCSCAKEKRKWIFFFFVSCLWSRWCHPPPGHPRPLSASLKPSLPPGEPGEHARHPEHLPGHGHGGGRGGGVERAALHRQEGLQSTRGETLRPPTPSWVGHSLAGWAWAFLGCSLKGSSSVLWASDQCPCDIPSFWGALPHPGTYHLPCPAPSRDPHLPCPAPSQDPHLPCALCAPRRRSRPCLSSWCWWITPTL